MENTKKTRVGLGQKPRGKQAERGVETLPKGNMLASNEGQEQGVNEPVLEGENRPQGEGTLEEGNSPILDSEEKNDENGIVAVSEGESLEEMLAKSKQENPVMGGLRRATPEEEEAFMQQKIGNAIRDSGGFEATRLMSVEEANKYLQPLRSQGEGSNATPQLGQQSDGSFRVAVKLEEGYLEPVRQWAEAEGITVEEWCSRQLSHYLETWGQPAKSR